MEISKAHSLLGNAVEVGSANLTTKATDVGETKVIGDDDEEIGTSGSHGAENGMRGED